MRLLAPRSVPGRVKAAAPGLAVAIQPRKFQRTSGRRTTTKALDVVCNLRQIKINCKHLSQQIGQSSPYTVLVTEDLAKRGLIVKGNQGPESTMKPNENNPVVGWMKSQRV